MFNSITKWISENPVKASAIAVALGATVYVATNKNAQRKLGLSGTTSKKTTRKPRRRLTAARLK
jgi:hypothetical protein